MARSIEAKVATKRRSDRPEPGHDGDLVAEEDADAEADGGGGGGVGEPGEGGGGAHAASGTPIR